MKNLRRFAPVLVFWLMLEMLCGVANAASQVPYPEDPGWVTPYGCYDTNLGADGPQVGHTEIATISITPAQPPFVQHVTVTAGQGYWLMQVRGSWFVWNNEDGINNRTYETNGYDAPPGIVAVACPWPCLGLPPLPTTTTTLPEPYCAAPPTTNPSLPPLPLLCPEPGVLTDTPDGKVCQMLLQTTSTDPPDVSSSQPTQVQAEAVVATPRFTG